MSNGLKELPPEIGKLSNLTSLDLSYNKLTELPPEIGNLTNLTILFLMSNGLKELPPEIGKLSNLTSLYLRSNGLTEFPPEIGKLKNLSGLYLVENNLTELPPEIGNLTNLTGLNLGENDLKTLPPEVGKLSNLTSLDLSYNKLTELPLEIGRLTNLTIFDLGGNCLTELPPEIGNLTNLTSLGLSYNKLTELPPEIGKLTNLTVFSLVENVLKELPPEIGELTNLTHLFLDVNPLEKPPIEIAQKGIEAIRNYFTAVEVSKPEKLYEAKLIIVGRGAVGKTCLREKLKDNSYDINEQERTTEGVDIIDWKIDRNPLDKMKHFTIHMWDFGGQEIYHATHQFFLTKRSFYIFVWEARKDSDFLDFDYWLNTIKLLSDSSPVAIVLNKCDERIKEIDQASLKDKFHNIIGFFNVSCLTGKGIPDLTEFVVDNIVNLPMVGTDWPKVWTEIRQTLEEDERDYIDYAEYKEICRKHGLDEKQANHLGSYLHDLGVIIHFQDDITLKNIVILKPEWGTTAVYKVLDTKKVQENKGRFHFNDLHDIWGDTEYPSEKHVDLLALMEKFELCFNLIDTKEYIIPELLSSERPDYEWYADNSLRFEYHYEFLPAGIITRFIVRNHLLIEGNLYWKNGVILKCEGARARVVQETLNRKIRIAVEGENYKRELLAVIRNQFDHIHSTLNNPEVKEMVPCICKECGYSEPYFYDYSVLRKFIEKGKRTIICQNSTEDVSIDSLLGDIIKKEEYDDIFGKREEGDVIIKHYHLRGEHPQFFEHVTQSKIETTSEKLGTIKVTPEKSTKKTVWWKKWILPIIIGIGFLAALLSNVFNITDNIVEFFHKSDEQAIEKNSQKNEKQEPKKDSTIFQGER